MPKFGAAAREREPDTYVPYIGHAAPGVLLLDDGSLLAVLAVDGLSAELADVAEVNARHAALNVLLRNVSSDRVTLSSHLVRTLADPDVYPGEPTRSGFARDLDAAYRERLLGNRLFRNALFLSVLLRPVGSSGVLDGNVASLFVRRRRGDRARGASAAGLETIAALVATLVGELASYGVRELGLRERGGVLFSEPAEALRLILTGERLPVPLVDGHLGGAIYTDRVIVGREAIEIRGAGGSTFAAAFAMREYPATTWPGMFDALLGAPYRLVLTQTFGFLAKEAAQGIMGRKQNQMVAAGDKAASQAEALTEAADLLASNTFCMGDHHLTLVVFADSPDRLAAVAGHARRDLAESGAVVAREDLALEAAYWGQLPGNAALRVRPGAVTSRNFAAMAPLHDYPTGAPRGHWGAPITVFRTTGGTAYRFHLHAPTETVTDLGNVFVAGPSGSGKTTLIALLLAMAERQGAQVVFFDKDRGGEILARAVGGTYLVLPSGAPTGLAPLRALSDTPADREFVVGLVRGLVGAEGERDLLPEEERRLALGVGAVMSLPPEARSFAELRAFLGQSDPDGPGARLERWCRGGALGWAFDGEEDVLDFDASIAGVDNSALLVDDAATVREPMAAYQLFRIGERVGTGVPGAVLVDEAQAYLPGPRFAAGFDRFVTRLRKGNGLLGMAMQQPQAILRHAIGQALVSNSPTKFLFPNASAEIEAYRDGLHCTEGELSAVVEGMARHGRGTFLVKRDAGSFIARADLSALPDHIAILSADPNRRALAHRIMAEVGTDPAAWVPVYRRRHMEAEQ